jgi:hypothetical protein
LAEITIRGASVLFRSTRFLTSSYDYENYPTEAANKLIQHLLTTIQGLKPGDKVDGFTVQSADEFEYKDPVDLSVSSHQACSSDDSLFTFILYYYRILFNFFV